MKILYLAFITVFILLSSCTSPNLDTPILAITEIPILTSTTIPTSTPVLPLATPTISSALNDRPVFLAWPLPAYISTTKIEQYPNTPWTWNYLGMNEGQQCPPTYGANFIYPYLLKYWRDETIPIERDIAQADPHGFGYVECYSTSISIGKNGHEGTDIEIPATGKTPVYAAADGKVMRWDVAQWNSMIVLKHCLGGTWNVDSQCMDGKQWYTTYMHIVPNPEFLVMNKDVAQGTQIARVFNFAEKTHLHFEVGLETRSYANFLNPWGEDSAPWLGCLWLNQSLCMNANLEYEYIAFYTTDERLLIKHSGSSPVEIYDAQSITKLQLAGNQIAVLDTSNRLLYRERDFDNYGESMLSWSLLAENIMDFQLTKTRLGMIDENQNMVIKENVSNNQGSLQLEVEDVYAFSISENRIGYLLKNGNLYIKEGNLSAEWSLFAQNVKAFQLTDNRLAILDGQDNLYVNEGKLSTSWEYIGIKVKAFQLTNTRLGIINTEDFLLIQEGSLHAEWIAIADKVVSFQLADDRILMTDENGNVKLKEGNLYQDWIEMPYSELKSVILNGEIPVFVR